MPLRTVLLLVLLLAVALFAALNWSAFLAPTTLSLGVTEVQAPLGLILLGLIAFITALFLAYLVYLQTTVLMESRRHAKELQVQRELADQAEASRFTELRAHLDSRLTEMENSLSAELRGSAQGSMRGSGQDSAQDFLPGPMRDSMGGPTPDRPDR
jgi:predicted deacetylase